jgi:hypothetical protein
LVRSKGEAFVADLAVTAAWYDLAAMDLTWRGVHTELWREGNGDYVAERGVEEAKRDSKDGRDLGERRGRKMEARKMEDGSQEGTGKCQAG